MTSTWTRERLALLQPPQHVVAPRLASAALAADSAVEQVIIHAGTPRRGDITLEIQGGDIYAVRRAVLDVVVDLNVIVEPYPAAGA